MWYLTNQEFCRVRTSNYRYKTGGDNGEIYFRISSTNENWFDLIWNICVKYSPSIDYITIMKDPQVFGKQFDYIEIQGTPINKMSLNDFLTIEGNPILESKDSSLQESVSLIDKESKLVKTSSVIDVKNIIANSKDMLRILYFYDSGNFYISSKSFNFIHNDLARIIYKNGEAESIEHPEGIGYANEYYPNALYIISISKENNFVTQDTNGFEYNVITEDDYEYGYEYENHYIMFRDEGGEDYNSCPLFKDVEIIDYSLEENFKDNYKSNHSDLFLKLKAALSEVAEEEKKRKGKSKDSIKLDEEPLVESQVIKEPSFEHN